MQSGDRIQGLAPHRSNRGAGERRRDSARGGCKKLYECTVFGHTAGERKAKETEFVRRVLGRARVSSRGRKLLSFDWYACGLCASSV